MSRLLESIRISNQKIHNLAYHQARLDIVQKTNYQGFTAIDLSKILSKKVPFLHPHRVFKCRVLYGEGLEKIEFHPYTPKPISTLKIVHSTTIQYSHKWENRAVINALYAERQDCDDVLIIKKGMVTDTSYCNIVFGDGQIWWTPARPLLAGTQRAKLLAEKRIQEKEIKLGDIRQFQAFKLINSMLPLEEAAEIPVSHIQ